MSGKKPRHAMAGRTKESKAGMSLRMVKPDELVELMKRAEQAKEKLAQLRRKK